MKNVFAVTKKLDQTYFRRVEETIPGGEGTWVLLINQKHKSMLSGPTFTYARLVGYWFSPPYLEVRPPAVAEPISHSLTHSAVFCNTLQTQLRADPI